MFNARFSVYSHVLQSSFVIKLNPRPPLIYEQVTLFSLDLCIFYNPEARRSLKLHFSISLPG